MEGINVVFTADKNYINVIGVAIYSVLKNLPKNVKARIFIFSSGFEKCDINNLKLFQKDYNCEIVNVPMEDYEDLLYFADDSQFKNKWITKACYYRLLIFKILPDYVKQCFYIDGDMIVDCDISKIKLEKDKIFAAVVEPHTNQHREKILKHWYEWEEFSKFKQNPLKYPLINAGFFLANISDGIFDEFMGFLQKHPNPPYADQDILNAIFGQKYQDKIQYLPIKYNVFADIDYTQKFDKLPYSKWTVIKAMRNPKIIHFAGSRKPWLGSIVKYSPIYWKYSKKTPFFNKNIYKAYKKEKFKNFYQSFFALLNKGDHKIIQILGIKLKVKRNKNVQKV